MEPKLYKRLESKCWIIKSNNSHHYHRLNGPAIELINDKKYYYIMSKIYYNFIEYIKAVIKYKKDNKL